PTIRADIESKRLGYFRLDLVRRHLLVALKQLRDSFHLVVVEVVLGNLGRIEAGTHFDPDDVARLARRRQILATQITRKVDHQRLFLRWEASEKCEPAGQDHEDRLYSERVKRSKRISSFFRAALRPRIKSPKAPSNAHDETVPAQAISGGLYRSSTVCLPLLSFMVSQCPLVGPNSTECPSTHARQPREYISGTRISSRFTQSIVNLMKPFSYTMSLMVPTERRWGLNHVIQTSPTRSTR